MGVLRLVGQAIAQMNVIVQVGAITGSQLAEENLEVFYQSTLVFIDS